LVALSALAEFDSPDVLPRVAACATDADEGVRGAAINLLGTRTGEAATRALLDLLPQAAITERVVDALAQPVEGRLAAVATKLGEADANMARMLVAVLSRAARPESSNALIEALSSPNVHARRAAAAALVALGIPQARNAIADAARRDPDPDVRQICAHTDPG
jgi:HEAT repeat protein